MTWWQRMLAYAAISVAPPAVILGPHVSAWPREVIGLVIATAVFYAVACELLILWSE